MTHEPEIPQNDPHGLLTVGVARPVAVPFAVPSPPAVRRHAQGDDILLLTSKRSGALADVGLLIVLALVVEVPFQVVITLALQFVPVPAETAPVLLSMMEDMHRWLLMPTLAYRALAISGLILLLAYFRCQSIRSLGLGKPEWAMNVLIGVITTGAIYMIMLGAGALVTLMYPQLMRENLNNVEQIQNVLPKLHPASFGLLAIVIGFYEELVFRGFFLTRLRRATSSWTLAVILSVILFTVPHALDQNWTALPAIALLGAIVSVVTIWRRSIVPAIVTHVLFNMLQFLIIYYVYGEAW